MSTYYYRNGRSRDTLCTYNIRKLYYVVALEGNFVAHLLIEMILKSNDFDENNRVNINSI